MLSPTQSLDGKLAKLPTGWAFPRDADSRMAALLAPLAQEHVTFERQAEAMLPEAPSPRQADHLLADYERVLGPDTCLADMPATQSDRQRSAYARWTSTGNPSIPGLIALAAAYGATITVTEQRRNCAGVLRAGRPVRCHPQQFVWIVGMPPATVHNTLIECVIRRAAPLHTVPVFRYPVSIPAVWDDFTWGDGSVWE